MQIIYMHHADRNKNKKATNYDMSKEDGITLSGEKEALILAKRLKNIKFDAIITSPYKRCVKTANIINKYQKLDLVYDDRLNEFGPEEEWQDVLKRNIEVIKDIIKNHEDDEKIICVTSGVNLSAFICFFYGIEPTNKTFFTQAGSISPIIFRFNKEDYI